MSVTIFHNPACETSRNTLALIRNAGIEPEIIEYLKTPPQREELRSMIGPFTKEDGQVVIDAEGRRVA